jgi:hypothetical protein
MKRLIVLTLILLTPLAVSQQAAAQEKKIAAGLGPELGINTLEGAAFGVVLGADYKLPIKAIPFAAGVNVGLHFNKVEFVLEPSAMFRWYFPIPGLTKKFHEKTEGSTFKGTFKPVYEGAFVQAEVGVTVIAEKDEDTVALFMGGLKLGYRLPLKLGLYVEPFARFGYPYLWGMGATAGMRF